jgi:hypothetical protein
LDDAIDRVNDRDRRLPAARHHVDVGRIEMVEPVDRRNRVRADGGGGEVHHALAMRLQHGVVLVMRACRGRIEHDL